MVMTLSHASNFRLLVLLTGRNEVVAKVMFLLVSVILLTWGGVCLSACWDTTPTSRPPPEQTPPGSIPPRSRHPPLEQTPPWSRHPPGADAPFPWQADSGIRSMSGRYVFYWNAFLFFSSLTYIFPAITCITAPHAVILHYDLAPEKTQRR